MLSMIKMKLVQLKLQFHSLYVYNETNFITWDIYMDLVTIKGNDASAPPKSAYLDGAIIPGRLPNLSILMGLQYQGHDGHSSFLQTHANRLYNIRWSSNT